MRRPLPDFSASDPSGLKILSPNGARGEGSGPQRMPSEPTPKLRWQTTRICSTVGAGVHALYLNRMLERVGWLRYRRAVQVSGFRAGSGLLDRARGWAVQNVPADLQGRIVRAMPGPWLGAVEASARYGDLDLPGTRALSDEMNYAATVRLNVAEGDREAAVAELSGLLRAWEVDGQPVVRALWTREELYSGPCVDLSPDLVLALNLRDGYAYTLLPSARAAPGETWRLLRPEEHVGGKGLGMNGTHRQHGVLVLHGKGVVAGAEIAAGMADIAPTLLHLLDESVPDHMDGRVIREALLESVEGPRAPFQGRLAPSRSTGAAEAEAVRARLERLGYL